MPRAKQGRREHLQIKRRLRLEMTSAETRLWSKIRGKQFQTLKFRRQHGIGPYIVDFYCPANSIVIEIDGDTHANQDQITKDKQRDKYLQSLGLQVIRYTNDDIIMNLDGVLQDLTQRLLTASTSPTPSLQRRGRASDHG
ncbi:MAG: endonuclease domain-containing protein [Nitrospiraceae bacterium]